MHNKEDVFLLNIHNLYSKDPIFSMLVLNDVSLEGLKKSLA